MKKPKKRTTRVSNDISLGNLKIEAKNMIKQYGKPLDQWGNPTDVFVEADKESDYYGDSSYPTLELHFYTMETDEEEAEREAKEQANSAQWKEHRRAQFEALKKEFG